jgi:hypothetical protein
LEYLIEQCNQSQANPAFIGLQNGKIAFHDMRDFDRMTDMTLQRSREQWWLQLKPISALMARAAPES